MAGIADLASLRVLEGECVTFCLFVMRGAAVTCYSGEAAVQCCEIVNCTIVLPF